MTIHAANGLEWPVVVVQDLARTMPYTFGAFVFDPELGVAEDFGDEDGEPALLRLIVDRKARAQQNEARRIFYVAPTRARDHLILTCTDGASSRPGWTSRRFLSARKTRCRPSCPAHLRLCLSAC